MLEHLYIKNVALIDEVSVVFNKGLNVLSGETGAGKSIIIDSINFVLGGKPGKDFIHKNEEKACVEALLSVKNKQIKAEFGSMGIEIEDDNSVLVSRIIYSTGKNISRINGKAVTIGMLRQLSALLIDIHGQHEHQSLLNPAKHIVLLDRFCTDKLNIYKNDLSAKYKEYKSILNKLNELGGTSSDREKKIEFYKYQIDEIEAASLKDNEENELNERRKVLINAERLKTLTNAALEFLYRSEEMSAVDRVSSALNNLYDIHKIDDSQKEVYEQLENVSAQLEDVVIEIRNYNDSIEDNPDELNDIENRLTLISRLKRKYGSDFNEIMNFYEDIKTKLDTLVNSEEEIKKLNIQKDNVKASVCELCQLITDERITAAQCIQIQIENILQDLGMKSAKFIIAVDKKDTFSINGWDKVEFLISPNLGEDLKPLAKIASGGEMSRVMLALKAVLADADNIETFIFDEIDTGISGRTAQQTGEKLALIARKRQILCITHLPQIAAMSDSHYLIEKTDDNIRTKTNIKELDYNETIGEIARMTGGAVITDSTLKAADEMKQLAIKIKKGFNLENKNEK